MSIFTDCKTAVQMLIDNPDLRTVTAGPRDIFTELDVIFLAAREVSSRLTGDEMQVWMDKAPRNCSNALGSLWRSEEVARFGPVQINEEFEPDYVRMASKIIYAGPGRVPAVETPNGTFPAITVTDDPNRARQGRRPGANRTDFEPWIDQPHLLRDPGEATTPERREIRRLKLRIGALERQLESCSEREHQMRERLATTIPREDYERVIAALRDPVG